MAHTPGTAATQYGVQVEYGAPTISVGSGDIIVQSGSHSKEGELKEYKDENGNVCTIVRVGDYDQFQFEGIVAADVTDKKKGEAITLVWGETTYQLRVSSWTVNWSNEDAKKISVSARTYPSVEAAIAAAQSNQQSQGGGS